MANTREQGSQRGEAPERLPPLPRLRLDTIAQVKRELAVLYREGKHGRRPVQDVARLANVLGLVGSLVKDHDLEKRLDGLEEQLEGLKA